MQTTTTNTHFAPAERATSTEVAAMADWLGRNSTLKDLIEGYPEICLVLNEQRQVVACNQHVLDMLGGIAPRDAIGYRPGEALGCIHSSESAGGCGTSEACQSCGAAEAIMECIRHRRRTRRECQLCTQGPEGLRSLDLAVSASPLTLDGVNLTILAGTDIGASKRRAVLERLFFHDVLNLAGGISGLSRLFSLGRMPLSPENGKRLSLLATQLTEEIEAQRDLTYAERGELAVSWTEVPVRQLFDNLESMFVSHPVAKGRTLSCELRDEPDLTLETDERLLRRVLGNLIKNAFEAIQPGQQVSVTCHRTKGGQIEFAVQDDAVMPRPVQLQIFQRSFSTKGGTGRGLGTYSVKLFTTTYLGGSVDFESNPTSGTTFRVRFRQFREAVQT